MDVNTREDLAEARNAKRKGLLKDQLELQKAGSGQNGKSRFTIKPLEEQLSFDKGFFIFIRAVKLLSSKNKSVIVVGLAGPSGSGKTAFSQKIQTVLTGCAVLSMDNYNDGSRVIDSNFDDPRLTDYDTLLANLKDLKEGRATQVPIYDFKVSRRVGYREVPVPTSRVVIIEGIYALSARLRPLEDLRVSITGGVHFDLVKRVLRDIDRSGQQPEEIIQQVSDTVYPMYKAFIEPDLRTAHLRIYNSFNPFSGFMNATYILKSPKVVQPEAIKSVLKANHRTRSESETYDIYLLPPSEDPETCQSWLRMRNRDGRYNLMFEEWVTDGPFIISPRITFEVSVRILGGLMALGYEIGCIIKRTSNVWNDDVLMVKVDEIEGMEHNFVQVQGKDRAAVAAAGAALGLDGTYIPRSYIEQVQLDNLVSSFQQVTEDMRRRFVVDGETLIDDGALVGGSPMGSGSFKRLTGFMLPQRPTLASSAPIDVQQPRRSSSDERVNGLALQPQRSEQLEAQARGGGGISHLLRTGGEGHANGLGSTAHSQRSAAPDLQQLQLDRLSSHGLPPRLPSEAADASRQDSGMLQVDRQLRHLRSRLDAISPSHSEGGPLAEQVAQLAASQQQLTQQLQELVGWLKECSSPHMRALGPFQHPQTQQWEPAAAGWPAAVTWAIFGAACVLAVQRWGIR